MSKRSGSTHPDPPSSAGTPRPLTPAERQARHRERHPDRVRAVKQRFYRRHRDRLVTEGVERHRADPVKHLARQRLLYAVRVGKVERPTVCDRAAEGDCLGRIEAHHQDYSKPLDVDWLCVRHHHRAHAEERAATDPRVCDKCEREIAGEDYVQDFFGGTFCLDCIETVEPDDDEGDRDE